MTLVGNKISHFTIVEALGRGGMGDVYAAYDKNLKRKVAVKAIQAGRGLSPVAKARFLREAQILSQLDHPGICRIYDYLEFEGREYLVLELIEGRTLASASGELGYRAKLDIARQIAQILDSAHAEGVVHRDLKPDNVMLTAEGQIKLLDFGIARSLDDGGPELEEESAHGAGEDPGRTVPLAVGTTAPGTLLGTPLFMSPEQAGTADLSPASDMYSFGLLLQWLFTGSYAYGETGDLAELLDQVLAARTRPARGIDRDLAALIERLKSKSPARRPTALASRERLEWIRRKPYRRNRRLVAAAVAAVVLLAGFKYTTDLRSERRKAEQNRAQAEDLMGFMLGDLRDKLEPVGRLDVLDDVGTKALEYYAARRSEDLADEELFKLARAMVQIGEVRLNQGDAESARVAFQEALATSEDIVARNPSNTEWLAGLGAVRFWIGSIDYSQGRLDAAEDWFRAYLEIGNRLVAMEPDNPDWQMEVAYGTTNLAALAEERADFDTALDYIQRSVEVKRRLAGRSPTDADLKYSLANSLSWAGRMLDRTGDPHGALTVLGEARSLVEELIDRDPANTTFLDLQSVTLQLRARVQDYLGLAEDARRSFQADLVIITRLAAHDPDNVVWCADLASSQRSLGNHLLREQRIAEARGPLHEGHDLILKAHQADPTNTEYLLQLAYSRIAQAKLALAEGRPDRAVRELDTSVGEIEGRGAAALDPQSQLFLGQTLLWRGIARADRGEDGLAAADWARARGFLEPLVSADGEMEILLAWTRLMVLLEDRDQARRVAANLVAKDFARRDFVELCRDYDLTTDS